MAKVCKRTERAPRGGNNRPFSGEIMPKAHQEWKVLPHGKLAEIDPNIMTVTGLIRMPLVTLPRRMTVARLTDKRLVIFSAIALDEEGMHALESYGTPAFLIVPSAKHRLDAGIWKQRFPAMQVIAPAGARRRVADVVPVDTSEPEFGDPTVRFITVPGTARCEGALLIHTLVGSTLVLNDLVGNIRNSSGFGGWFLRKTNFAGDEPQVPKPVQWTLVDDKDALRAQFLQWAALPGLKRILVSHGDPIDYQPAEVLRDLAQSLANYQMEPPRPKPAL
jgi:hypothetical protein